MTTVSSSGATAASVASAASSSSTTSSSSGNAIAGNFQDFLLLLTTQLQNQSPLDPLDTNQFTQQLVQFASVEQQLKSNDTLGSILTAVKSSSTVNAASYIGLNVTADGSTAKLANGSAQWTIDPAKAASKAVMTITDASGAVVAAQTTTLKPGSQSYTWDGKGSSGVVQSAGDYTLAVSATDASGQPVAVSSDIAGQVTAVDVSGTTPTLTVGSAVLPITKLKTIANAN